MVHSRSTGERYYDEHWLDIQFRHWVLPTRVHTYIVLPVFGVATTFILIALLGNQESGFATLGLMLGPIAALAWFCRHQWWVGQSIAKVKASMVESIEDSTQFRLGDKPSGGDVR